MYYRIRFKAASKDFLFELKQEKNVHFQDVGEKEYIESGRTYIVKRIPIEKQTKKGL